MPGLAYPCGVAPGFDPSHAAAKNCLMSAISAPVVAGGSAGGSVNLLNGLVGATGTGIGGGGFSVDGIIGPFVNYGTNAAGQQAVPSGSHLPVTFAAIFVLTSLASAQNILSTEGWRFTFDGTNFTLVSNGVTNLSSTIAPVVNVPYFLAASASSTNCHYAAQALNTGQLRTFSKGSGSGAPVSDSRLRYPGADGLGQNGLLKLACGMMSSVFLSPAQLAQWAADPWSFWYPQDSQ